MIIYLKAELFDFCYLQQNAFDKEDAYCPLKRQIQLFSLINQIFETPFKFSAHDEARQFFLRLQNTIKNMNFMSFEGNEYMHAWNQIKELVQSQT